MTTIGDMRDRYLFQQRGAPAGDADQGDWATIYTAAAATTSLRGGDGVQALRLEGRQPVVITIWTCALARGIDNSWRAVDARDATRVFEITGAAPNADDITKKIDILAVRKVGQVNG